MATLNARNSIRGQVTDEVLSLSLSPIQNPLSTAGSKVDPMHLPSEPFSYNDLQLPINNIAIMVDTTQEYARDRPEVRRRSVSISAR